MAIGESITRMISEKKQWRQQKARLAALPRPHRDAAEAVEHYLLRVGAVFVNDGDALLAMFGDLADLFEQAAADDTAIRDLVGEDPVAFVEDFLANYPSGSWLTKERARLNESIDRAAQEDT